MLIVNHNSWTVPGPQGGSQIWSTARFLGVQLSKIHEFLIGHFMNQLYRIILDNRY